MNFLEAIIGLAIGLILLTIAYALIQKYVYEQPVEIINDVVSWEGVGGIAGQAECMKTSRCDGRPGWVYVTRALCPDDKPYGCLLPPNNRGKYFTPGSLVVSYDGNDYKLVPDTLQQVVVAKNDIIEIYYVPFLGTPGQGPADEECRLFADGKGKSGNFDTIEQCYKKAKGLIDNMVLLWSGTGAEFVEKAGPMPKKGYALLVTVKKKGESETTETIKKAYYPVAIDVKKG